MPIIYNDKVDATDILAKSIELFGPNGKYWIVGREHGEDSHGHDTYCSIGAIHAAGQELKAPWKERRKAAAALTLACTKLNDQCTGIIGFNDHFAPIQNGFKSVKKAFCLALKSRLVIKTKTKVAKKKGVKKNARKRSAHRS